MQEVSRQVHILHQGLNLAPPDPDFDLCCQQWDGANGKKEECDQWPQATQRTMMLGMIQREHTSSEEFFDLCQHSSFETTLMTHRRDLCFHHRPSGQWLGWTNNDLVLPLPWHRQGHPDRKKFHAALRHNPHRDQLQTVNHNKQFHIFGLACFHAFELEEQGVSMDDFALT